MAAGDVVFTRPPPQPQLFDEIQLRPDATHHDFTPNFQGPDESPLRTSKYNGKRRNFKRLFVIGRAKFFGRMRRLRLLRGPGVMSLELRPFAEYDPRQEVATAGNPHLTAGTEDNDRRRRQNPAAPDGPSVQAADARAFGEIQVGDTAYSVAGRQREVNEAASPTTGRMRCDAQFFIDTARRRTYPAFPRPSSP